MAGLPHAYDDGGRSLYYKGTAGDCVPRAYAIYLQRDYKQVYDELQAIQKAFVAKHGDRDTRQGRGIRKSKAKRAGSVRNGTWKQVSDQYNKQLGLRKIRTGEGSHRTPISQAVATYGDGIYAVNRHKLAVIDGVVRDTYNSVVTHYYCDPFDCDGDECPGTEKGSIWVIQW